MTSENVDNISTAIFGSSGRLGILRAIAAASEDDLYPARIAELSSTRASQVGVDMKRLREVGLLKPRKVPGSSRLNYTRAPSVLWDLAESLYTESVRRKPRG